MQEKIPVRKVDTEMYLGVMEELLEEGKEIPLLITGNSMSPFLVHGRDTLILKRAGNSLKKGDMVFFKRKNGQYVMHRIRYIKKKNGKTGYYLIGDGQWVTEGPVERSQIFGLVTAVRRKGRWLGPGDFWWEFFSRVWLHMIPFRRIVTGLYGLAREKSEKQE